MAMGAVRGTAQGADMMQVKGWVSSCQRYPRSPLDKGCGAV